ncbi:MAG: hypothetical protein QW348_04490 [Ignisphaera sp.]
MALEDWRTYKRVEAEVKKGLTDEIHEFLTKVFNVYIVRFGPDMFKYIEGLRDKLISLTTRFDNDKYIDFCDSFSKVYKTIMFDKNVDSKSKEIIKELAQKTNSFFNSKGLQLCVKELKYYKLKIKTLFSGKNLDNAIVSIESEGRVVASTKTDESGLAEVEVPEGRYTIYVYKDFGEGKYIYEEKAVSVPQEMEIIFDVKETKSRSEIEKERGGKPLIKEVA